MSNVFIIGAGFSKGLASAPVTYELFEILVENSHEIINGENNGWNREATNFIRLLENLRDEVEANFEAVGRNFDDIDTVRGLYPIDIEYLCTLIELNAKYAYNPRSNRVGLDFPIPFLFDLNSRELERLIEFIKHQIFSALSPDQLRYNNDLLSRFVELLETGDKIISFNYDLVLDQSLWSNGVWTPIDGYGFSDNTFYPNILGEPAEFSSDVELFKPHGSLNWKIMPENRNRGNITILLSPENQEDTYFDGLDTEERAVIRRERNYYNNPAILPSFIKLYTERWYTKIIKKIVNSINDADTIHLIGYSLPDPDSLTQLMISNIPEEVPLEIVNPSIDNSIQHKLTTQFGIDPNRIRNYQRTVEQWLEEVH